MIIIIIFVLYNYLFKYNHVLFRFENKMSFDFIFKLFIILQFSLSKITHDFVEINFITNAFI